MINVELKGVLLVENGAPRAAVIRDEESGHQVFYTLEEMGAEELRHFLKEITLPPQKI